MLKYDSVILALYVGILLASMCELLMMHLSRCHSEPFAPLRGGKTAKSSQNHLAIMKWHTHTHPPVHTHAHTPVHTQTHTHSFLIITSCELNERSLRPQGQMCGRWWIGFCCSSSDKSTTAPIITSIKNTKIKTFTISFLKGSLCIKSRYHILHHFINIIWPFIPYRYAEWGNHQCLLFWLCRWKSCSSTRVSWPCRVSTVVLWSSCSFLSCSL